MFLCNTSENCDKTEKNLHIKGRNIHKMNMPHANNFSFVIPANSAILEYSDTSISVLFHSVMLIIHLSSL